MTIREAGGPVSSLSIGPRWLIPRYVFVSSPAGAHDVLAATSPAIDKGADIHIQFRLLLGMSLFSMSNKEWKPRRRTLQPIFTKKHVATFARHMSAAADLTANEWTDAQRVDLDGEARRLTLRVLSRSVFGFDLGDRAYDLGPQVARGSSVGDQADDEPGPDAVRWPTPAKRRTWRDRVGAIHAALDDAVARTRRASPPTRS